MPKGTETELRFPVGGLDVSTEYQSQPPDTAAGASNVRVQDPLAELFRGGSRPGLSKLVAGQVGGVNSPVQHLAVLVTSDTDAVNTDYDPDDARSLPSRNPGMVVNVDYLIDPSTNNNAAGLGDRNPGRAVPVGGSGRRHLRMPAVDPAPDPGGDCVCRTYHVAGGFEESWRDFTICDNAEFPYDFTTDAALGWGGDPLVAPGPEAPTLAELLAIIEAAGGPPATSQYDSVTDVPCE